jgi:amino acid adenylation domain-containing protein/thioester reductase-like protein
MKFSSACLHELFCQQVQRTPDALAVADISRPLTYENLDRQTDILALYLKNKGVDVNSTVAIFMDKSVEYVIALIAILKAGAAYLPLDMAYPDRLIEHIINETQSVVILTQPHHEKRLQHIGLDTFFALHPTSLSHMDKDEIYTFPDMTLDHPAYIVYSSGTTGEPKGIVAPHRGAVISYYWRYGIKDYGPGERVACNIFFVWECLRPLLRGGSCFVIPDNIIYDPEPLLNYLANNQITEVLFTPSLFETILLLSSHEQIHEKFSTVNTIWLNGEVVTGKLLKKALDLMPESIALYNLYSISETHDVCLEDMRHTRLPSSNICLAGKPMPDATIKVMGPHGNVLQKGNRGELFIGGECLALCYLNKPHLTQERFVTIENERYFKTGDLAILHENNTLEICGRCDFMVKIRGYSVHIGMIESALLTHAHVKACAVVTEGEEGEDKRLIAYLVPDDNFCWTIDPETSTCPELTRHLKPHLAHFMIPGVYVLLDRIPINPVSGKIDTRSLKAPKQCQHIAPDQIVLNDPTSINEQRDIMRKLWESVLKLSPGTITNQDNFFEYGGHSLLAVQLLPMIKRIYKIKILVKDIYEHPTVSQLIDFFNNEADDSIEPVSIKSDAYLDPAIQIPSVKTFTPIHQASSVFLTGATGYLGAFLLEELLRKFPEIKVYCLIRTRQKDTQLAMQRIRNTLYQYDLYSLEIESRIVPVVGDLTLPEFGLSKVDFSVLADEIDLIFHCGSLVNYVYSYKVMKPSIVNGTHEILRLASMHRLKPVHYISTNGIFIGKNENCCENRHIDIYADKLIGGYEQAKWVAEKMVWMAIDRGMQISIYRPGNIGHHRNTGAYNANDFQTMLINTCMHIQYVPSPVHWGFEMTPIDFLVKSLVRFAEKEYLLGRVFNIVENNPFPVQKVFDMLLAHKMVSHALPLNEWRELLQTAFSDETASKLHVFSQAFQDLEYYLVDENNYHTSKFEHALSQCELDRYQMNNDYFEILLKRLRGHGIEST